MVGEQLVLSFMHQPVEPKIGTGGEDWTVHIYTNTLFPVYLNKALTWKEINLGMGSPVRRPKPEAPLSSRPCAQDCLQSKA